MILVQHKIRVITIPRDKVVVRQKPQFWVWAKFRFRVKFGLTIWISLWLLWLLNVGGHHSELSQNASTPLRPWVPHIGQWWTKANISFLSRPKHGWCQHSCQKGSKTLSASQLVFPTCGPLLSCLFLHFIGKGPRMDFSFHNRGLFVPDWCFRPWMGGKANIFCAKYTGGGF